MSILTDIIDIGFSLMRVGEARLNNFKRCISNFIAGILLQMIAAFLGVVAILFLIAAMFLALLDALGGPIAALLSGGAVLLLAALVAGIGIWRSR